MNTKRSKTQLSALLAAYPTGNLCNASSKVKAMHPRIRPIAQGVRLAGPVRTAKIAPGQNAAIHRAVYLAEPGDVLVVDAGASAYYGPFGDILARACLQRGISGLVIDGTVRDSAEIIELGFPVFCSGCSPAVTAKTEAGEVDIAVECGGIGVRPGDIVVGDADGVVVIPAGAAEEISDQVRVVARKERDIIDQLEAGKTTYEIFELSKLYAD